MKPEKMTTYTLRLADDLKRRLERSADRRGISLNQFIIDIAQQYYSSSGYVQSQRLASCDGRIYEIRTARSDSHHPDMPTLEFFIDDPRRERELAHYTIGLHRQLLNIFGVRATDQYDVILEIGVALLHYYNAHQKDVTALAWEQFGRLLRKRILMPEDVDGLSINNHEQFLKSLSEPEDFWRDKLLLFMFTSNMGIWAKSGALLGYFSEVGEIFDVDGRHVAQVKIKDARCVVSTIDGKIYLGDLVDNRLLYAKELPAMPFPPQPQRNARPSFIKNLEAESEPALTQVSDEYENRECSLNGVH